MILKNSMNARNICRFAFYKMDRMRQNLFADFETFLRIAKIMIKRYKDELYHLILKL